MSRNILIEQKEWGMENSVYSEIRVKWVKNSKWKKIVQNKVNIYVNEVNKRKVIAMTKLRFLNNTEFWEKKYVSECEMREESEK